MSLKERIEARSSKPASNWDRYLRIVMWAEDRYTSESGVLVVSINGKPSLYKIIETLAWDRYVIGIQRVAK
jgi:hypothetical protein